MSPQRLSRPRLSRRAFGVLAAAALAIPASAGIATGAQTPTPSFSVSVGGWAENAEVLPDGSVLVSNLGDGRLERVTPSTGAVTTVAAVDGPGGIAVVGSTAYVVTGNSPLAAITRKGGVVAVDLGTGATRTVVTGYGEGNGLDLLPDGDLAMSVTVGRGAGVVRIDPATGRSSQITSRPLGANGLATGPDGKLYVGSTVTGQITRVDPATGATSRAAGTSALLDDFAFLPDGRIVAATVAGAVDVIDLRTGRSRPVSALNLGATSAHPFGDQILLTTITGRVYTIPGV